MGHEGPFYAQQPVVNQYQYNGKELNEEFGLGWYNYGMRIYDPAVGRFPSIDPIADNFAWVSPYNYAENSPISNIDLYGLQKYFAADGSYVGQYKGSSEIRVLINNENRNFLSMAINNPSGLHPDMEAFYQNNSVRAYVSTRENQESVLNDWAIKNLKKTKANRIEYAMSLFTRDLTDKNGNSFEVFMKGTTAEGKKTSGGGMVNLLDSHPARSKFENNILGWERSTTIHTHLSGPGLNFSGSKEDDYRDIFSVDADVASLKGFNLYLASPDDNRVGLFNPSIYNKELERYRFPSGYINISDKAKAANAAISVGFTLKR